MKALQEGETMIINAENLIIGRLSTVVAKHALLGETVNVINSEKAVITGLKKNILAHYEHKIERGNPFKGPFFPRTADKILKRTIRGMVPWKETRGKEAFKRIKCYLGTPEEFKNQEAITIQKADVAKTKSLRYITLEQLSTLLRGK